MLLERVRGQNQARFKDNVSDNSAVIKKRSKFRSYPYGFKRLYLCYSSSTLGVVIFLKILKTMKSYIRSFEDF